MKFTAIAIAAFAAVASAVTPADTSKPPSGNPIALPGLQERVPVGKPYTITWQPTTQGKVSILLLRGPSTNVKFHSVIADTIANTGKYTWTPSTSLENDVSHYGIQIIVEGTGQYQYSTQFGIKNDNQQPEPKPTKPDTHEKPPHPSHPAGSKTPVIPPVVTMTTTICDAPTSTAGGVAPTGTAPGTIVQPPVGPTGTSILVTPTPTPSAPPFEGAAGRNVASMGGALLALAAILAF